MDTIVAGESYPASCPNGMRAEIRVGDLLPNPEKPVVKILSVENSDFVVGPMKAGEIIVNIPCENTFQQVSFYVNEMDPNAAMNRYSPLGSEKVAYPWTIYLLIAAIILSPLLIFLGYKFKKKKTVAIKSDTPKIKQSSRALLEKELVFLETSVPLPESHHFHSLYKKLRKFIEKELNLKTKSLTTQEFLGTFRALALQQSTNQNLISQLEYLLRTADDVRFAGKAFTAELWRDYLQKIRSVIAAFPETKREGSKKK
jgi:hypothetical protein